MVLFGPSGAGKSLILKMISGIVRPDSGEVSIDSEKVFDSAKGMDAPIRKRRIGYLFQDYALFPHMTVFDNIAYGTAGLTEGDARKRVGELIEVMRLTGLNKRFPHELSGGQKQRTALARTLASSPRILLLDEPFSALDFQVREKLRMDLINVHRIFPVTTILVTHDLEEAFMVGNRIAVINNGSLEQTGTREDVFYRPKTKNVARFLGVRNIFSGRIISVRDSEVVINNPEIGFVKTYAPKSLNLTEGSEVTFCIRPEEILVIRPDRSLDKVADNVLEGDILSTVGKGSTHILYLNVTPGKVVLKIELPNFVLRKLGLTAGKHIRVSLKKENIWIIP